MSSSQERSAHSFVERHGLWSDEQFEAAAKADKSIEEHGLEVVRLSFPDQHGILRGKSVMAGEAAAVMRNGCSHDHHAAGQGHRAQDRVSGLHRRAAASAWRRWRAAPTSS